MRSFSKPGDQKLLQELNRTLVLNTIHHYGSISRIEISKLTKLSQSTVSNVVDGLHKEDILMEVGTGSSSKAGGRRPTILTINPRHGYIVAVGVVTEAFHITLQIALFDLKLGIVDELEVEVREKGTQLIEAIKSSVASFIANHAGKFIKGIGFSIPTVLNREGVIFRGHLLELDNYPFEQQLSLAFPSIPIVAEQEQHAAILGEFTIGPGKDVDNLLYVTVGRGIGSSLIVGGKLIRGENGGAGEIGHMSINKLGEPCICGKVGCLRLYATELVFINKIKEAIENNVTLPGSVYNPDVGKINVLEVYREAVRGEPFCRALLTGMLDDLVVGLSNLIYLCNPKKIIVGGNLLLSKSFAIPFIADKLKGMVDLPTSQFEVMEAHLGAKSSLYGVASIILERHFLHRDLLVSKGDY